MANLKDIKDRISSIESTQKITKAMKMVAAAKVKKSENAVKAARPFAAELVNMFKRLLSALNETELNDTTLKTTKNIENYPVLLKKREKKTAGILLVTSNKGLAGAYTANLVRYTLKLIKEYAERGIKSKLFIIGQKGYVALKHRINENFEILKYYPQLTSEPNPSACAVISEDMADAFVEGKIDSIELVTTRFKNMMSYSVEEWAVLPLDLSQTENSAPLHTVDSLMDFDTNKEAMLKNVVPLFISNIIYQAILEATASELASRMTAMSAATNNAQDMIRLLTIDYNKARQAAITNEITEVVSGADALKN